MLLSCDKGESVAHLQQITGNVLYQLFFYVPFVSTFFGSCQIKDVRVFQQVVGKVALRCGKRGGKIIDFLAVNLLSYNLLSICIFRTLLLQPISTDCFIYQYSTPNGSELLSMTIWLAQLILATGDARNSGTVFLYLRCLFYKWQIRFLPHSEFAQELPA